VLSLSFETWPKSLNPNRRYPGFQIAPDPGVSGRDTFFTACQRTIHWFVSV